MATFSAEGLHQTTPLFRPRNDLSHRKRDLVAYGASDVADYQFAGLTDC
jgi:hypothetical protein